MLQLPHDYARSLHTQHLSYTYRASFAKTAIRLDFFCSGVAMRWFERGELSVVRERDRERGDRVSNWLVNSY